MLVAKEKILAGQVIKDPEKLFVLMSYPTGSTPNAISNLDDLKNKIVNKTVQPGQWLTPDDISGNFGIELPKGYYAMSVKVDATQAGERLHPAEVAGERGRHASRPQGNGKPKVMTILQDVLVLAVDAMSVRPEDKMAYAASEQRLARRQAERLAAADLGPEPGRRSPAGPAVLTTMRRRCRCPRSMSDLDTSPATTAPGETNDPKPTHSRLAVAKQDIEAGTEIDDPEKFFKVKKFPTPPDKAIAADAPELAQGQGHQALRCSRTAMLTTKHFTGRGVHAGGRQAGRVNRHVMFIQNGGSAPRA